MKKKNMTIAWISFFLFIVLIVLLKVYDVAAVGPEDTKIGFSHLNASFHEMFPLNMTIYKLTEILGYVALLLGAGFALMGFLQLVKGKSLSGVDREIYCLAGLYVVMGVLYVLFEKLVINYRPEILPDEIHPEASFPSSHTMLACVIFGSACTMLSIYMEKSTKRMLMTTALDILIFLTVFGRLICGVHWLTDIIGGVLISVFLVRLFNAIVLEEKE